MNPKLPRIAKRFEAALNALDIKFYKTRPASLFLKKMASDPSSVVPEQSALRFEALRTLVRSAFAKLIRNRRAMV